MWPSRAVSSRSGARTSHSLMLLSTDAVAITQSLYLHQSADRISKACAVMLSVGLACRRSQIFTLQSPDALMNTSACAGFLQAVHPGISAGDVPADSCPGTGPSLATKSQSVWPAVTGAGKASCRSHTMLLLSSAQASLGGRHGQAEVRTMLLRTHSMCAP